MRQLSFDIDEPGIFGGTDTAFTPVELILASLGTCQETMYNAYASVTWVPVDSVKVKGDLNLNGLFGLDESTNAGFNNIYYESEIKSSADDEGLYKLIESHCPLLDTLTRKINVEGKVNVIKLHEEKVA